MRSVARRAVQRSQWTTLVRGVPGDPAPLVADALPLAPLARGEFLCVFCRCRSSWSSYGSTCQAAQRRRATASMRSQKSSARQRWRRESAHNLDLIGRQAQLQQPRGAARGAHDFARRQTRQLKLFVPFLMRAARNTARCIVLRGGRTREMRQKVATDDDDDAGAGAGARAQAHTNRSERRALHVGLADARAAAREHAHVARLRQTACANDLRDDDGTISACCQRRRAHGTNRRAPTRAPQRAASLAQYRFQPRTAAARARTNTAERARRRQRELAAACAQRALAHRSRQLQHRHVAGRHVGLARRSGTRHRSLTIAAGLKQRLPSG